MFGQLLRTHGEHLFWSKPVPDGAPTLAQTFRNAGYRTFAVGKLYVTP
jgi:arylsulfatase A-like enzyme